MSLRGKEDGGGRREEEERKKGTNRMYSMEVLQWGHCTGM